MSLPIPPPSCLVSTPPSLARAMVDALGDEPKATWLDPCTGQGVFVSALLAGGVEPTRITSLDLDPAVPLIHEDVCLLRGVDFLEWAGEHTAKFDRVVANPPYVKVSTLDGRLVETARRMNFEGRSLPLRSSYWYPFLLATLGLLRPGGSMCFVVPAAWTYAKYAGPLRVAMPRLFETVEVHRSEVPLFPTVGDGCVVLVGRGYGTASTVAIERNYESSEGLLGGLSGREGASAIPRPTQSLPHLSSGPSRRLGDVMEIRIGGVTGDGRYFLLSEERRKELRLPTESVRPVVTRSRHLEAAEVTASSWRTLRDANERVLLFDPSPEMAHVPAVRRYLDLPERQGGHRRAGYKIQQRDPWYHTPLFESPDGFLSGMTIAGPWISLNRVSQLSATNTLYVVKFRERLNLDEKASWCLALMSTAGHNQALALAKRYPEGLLKVEPGDLASIQLQTPQSSRGAMRTYRRAIRLLKAGQGGKARALADQWLWKDRVLTQGSQEPTAPLGHRNDAKAPPVPSSAALRPLVVVGRSRPAPAA